MDIGIIINELFDNAVFKGLGIPIILTFLSVGFEIGSSLAKGISKGELKFRIWIRQQVNNQEILTSLSHQSVETIRKSKKLVDIEPMYSINILNISPIAIDLGIGALATDISFLLIKAETNTLLSFLLLLHVAFLVVITISLSLVNLHSPEEEAEKKKKAKVAIVFGFLAILSAFLPNLI